MPGVMGGAAKNDRLATDAAIVDTSLATFNDVYRRNPSIPDASRNNNGDPQQLVVSLQDCERAYQDFKTQSGDLAFRVLGSDALKFSGGSCHPRSVDELVPSSRSGPRRQSKPPIPVTFTMWFDDHKVSFTGYSYEDILEQQKAWMIAQKIREEKAQYEEEDKKEEADGNDADEHHQPESGDSYLNSMD